MSLSGRVDVEEAAEKMGLTVVTRDLGDAYEVLYQNFNSSIAYVAPSLATLGHRSWYRAPRASPRESHIWLRANTLLAVSYEREAEDFAWGLLVDEDEILKERLPGVWDIASHFDVPEEMVEDMVIEYE